MVENLKSEVDLISGRKRFISSISSPHTFVLLFFLILLATCATFLIPAGSYDRIQESITGRTIAVPGSYHIIEASPVSPLEIPIKIYNGFLQAADVIFFIMIIGGAFQVISSTKTLDACIGRVARHFRGKEAWIVPIFLALFSIPGFTMSMAQEVMLFVPIGIMMARALGFDVVTGTAIVMLGANLGVTAGLFNPFTVGVAQTIAQLPLFSGLYFRVVFLLVSITVTSLYILRYAYKVKANPSKSVVAGMKDADSDNRLVSSNIPELSCRHYIILFILITTLGVLMWGINNRGWFMQEMAALFLTMGIICGIVAGYGPNKIALTFSQGIEGIASAAMITGLARAIVIVLEDANIIDTIVYSMTDLIGRLPPAFQIVGMFMAQIIISLIITSSTGHVFVIMPLMVPVADLLGISRQTAIFAYQCADGFTNNILPTSAPTVGALSVAKIPFERWLKFMMPLELILLTISMLFLLIAQSINYA